jgi:hypothetical protein
VSQNRPDEGRRTAAEASISAKGLKGSRKGGWRSLAVMRSNLARVKGAIVTGMAPHPEVHSPSFLRVPKPEDHVSVSVAADDKW